MSDYIKRNDLEFATQLTDFGNKIGNYPELNVTAAEQAQAKADALYFTFITGGNNLSNAYMQSWTSYKDLSRHGDGVLTAMGPLPATPAIVVPATAPATAPDIEGRFRRLAQRVKKQEKYNVTKGLDLGIEAIVEVVDYTTYKPDFGLSEVASQILITWKKLKADGIIIYKAIDAGAFVKFDFDGKPNYLDRSPMPPVGTNQVWSYKLIYTKNDEPVGSFSDIQQIIVKG
jgi:hypothetical protein